MVLKIKQMTVDFEKVPTYGSIGSAGLDLYAPYDVLIYAQTTRLIGLGFAVEIPEGYFGMIVPRSGSAIKHGLLVKNSPAIIDSDYRGEVLVALWNTGHIEKEILTGDRIAQMLILPYVKVTVEEVDELLTTVRGEGGIGSTGA